MEENQENSFKDNKSAGMYSFHLRQKYTLTFNSHYIHMMEFNLFLSVLRVIESLQILFRMFRLFDLFFL